MKLLIHPFSKHNLIWSAICGKAEELDLSGFRVDSVQNRSASNWCNDFSYGEDIWGLLIRKSKDRFTFEYFIDAFGEINEKIMKIWSKSSML